MDLFSTDPQVLQINWQIEENDSSQYHTTRYLHTHAQVDILITYLRIEVSNTRNLLHVSGVLFLDPPFFKTPTMIGESYYQLQRGFLILDSTKILDTKP